MWERYNKAKRDQMAIPYQTRKKEQKKVTHFDEQPLSP